ncbi:MAG: hypothetical protein B6U72_00750 [Candidatus Altiarchaeales archaeon ex4484_2]|nr:MAG: hypothetical protein B6U72_00750 [Candidatus Altiarchaeales archaeon ex4484_2]
MSDETKKLVEAALFIAGRPLSVEDIASACSSGNPGSIRQYLEELREEYLSRGTGIVVEEVSDGYRMTLEAGVERQILHLAPEKEISSAALKTLALIAHQQPVKQSDVVRIRGNRAYRYIKELREQDFIETKKHGRTLILSTTPRFSEYFNITDMGEVKEI